MQLEIEIDQDKQIARMRVVGAWDVSVYSERIMEFTQDSNFVPGMPSIWDMRDADLSQVTAEDMASIGQHTAQLAEHRGNAIAALVTPDDFRYGMGRMLQVVGESPNLEIAVFRDFGAAEEWIDARRNST